MDVHPVSVVFTVGRCSHCQLWTVLFVSFMSCQRGSVTGSAFASWNLQKMSCHVTDGHCLLRNDLYCVRWGVKLYSLTHSSASFYRVICYSIYCICSFYVTDVSMFLGQSCGNCWLAVGKRRHLMTCRMVFHWWPAWRPWWALTRRGVRLEWLLVQRRSVISSVLTLTLISVYRSKCSSIPVYNYVLTFDYNLSSTL